MSRIRAIALILVAFSGTAHSEVVDSSDPNLARTTDGAAVPELVLGDKSSTSITAIPSKSHSSYDRSIANTEEEVADDVASKKGQSQSQSRRSTK